MGDHLIECCEDIIALAKLLRDVETPEEGIELFNKIDVPLTDMATRWMLAKFMRSNAEHG